MYALIVVLSILYVIIDVMGIFPKSNDFAGPYCVEVASIYAMSPEETPDYNVEYYIKLVKISKYGKGVKGCITVKKPVPGPIGAKMKSLKKSDGSGQFINMALGSIASDNICEAESYSTFFKQFNGSIFDEKCGFKKGSICLNPPLDMDKVIHMYCEKLVYGFFNFSLIYHDPKEKPIIGYNIGLHFKPLAECTRK